MPDANAPVATTELEQEPAPVTEAQFVPVPRIDNEYSPTIGQFSLALSKAQGAMENGIKTITGHNYKYMGLDQLLDIVRPALAANGLCILQTHELVVRKNGPSVITHTMISHESSEWVRTAIEVPIEASKMLSKAQMLGVAATYGRRYAIQSICLVASETDTDSAKS